MSSYYKYDLSEIPAKIYYKNASEVFLPEFGNLDADSFRRKLGQMNIDADDMESFFGSFGRGLSAFGKTAVNVLPQAVSVVAPIAGTVVGGPFGAVLGQTAGNLAAKALRSSIPKMGGKGLSQVMPFATQIVSGALGGSSGATLGQAAGGMLGGSSAASKLLQAIFDKKMLMALGAGSMPNVGAQNILVGQKKVDLPKFYSLLGQLANMASAEYFESHGESFSFAEDNEAFDPFEPHESAMELYEDLQKARSDEFSRYAQDLQKDLQKLAALEAYMENEAYDEAYDEDALVIEYYSDSDNW